jgi:iron complex outermembrane recepter protein
LTTADPSSIPAGAIERVEIIQDGGSATYGSDAVAGVINIILKKDFSGAESVGSYTSADEYDSYNLGQTLGTTWSGGSALLSASFEKNSDLLNSDRDYYTQDLRPYGGRNARSTSCGASAPGTEPALNVLLDNGTWFNSATGQALPVTTGGALTATTPARNTPPGVGQGITCDPAANNRLINPVEKWAVVGNLRHDLNDRVSLFADAKFSTVKTDQRYQPTNLVINEPRLNTTPGSRLTSGTLVIPATNPFFRAPPGYVVTPNSVEQVFVNSRTFGAQGDVWNHFKSESYMLDVGATTDLWGDWQLTGDFNYGYSTSYALNLNSSGPNPNALLAAAFGTTVDTALDPFGGRTNPAVVAAIMDWPLLFDAQQRIYDVNLRADGSLFDLPGGTVKLAVGLANRHEQYEGRNPIGVPGQPNALPDNAQEASRLVNAANAELAIPVFGSPNALPGLRRVQLSIAARIDDYSDVGRSTNPKYGIVWSPLDDLNLRASFGKSFHAPQLADSYAIDTRAGVNVTTGGTIVPNNMPVGVSTLGFAGGDPDLESETAETWSFGLDYKPEFIPGLSLSLSYFDIDYRNQVIIPQNNPAAVNNPALAGSVFIYNQTSTTGCGPTGAPVAAGTGGPCYAPIPQNIMAELLAGVRGTNFTGVPTTYFVTDLRRTNLGANLITGWDFDFSYRYEIGEGTLSAGLTGEYLTKFLVQSAPGAPYNDALTSGLQYFQNDAGAQSIIPWHARATLGWQQGALSTQVAVSYTGDYDYLYTPVDYSTNPNGVSLPNRKQNVDPFVTVDLNAIWDFPNESGMFEGLRLQANVYNILDEDPPLQMSTGDYAGFAPNSASPLGRTVRLGLTKRW